MITTDKGSQAVLSLQFGDPRSTSEILCVALSLKIDAKIVKLNTDNFLSPVPEAL